MSRGAQLVAGALALGLAGLLAEACSRASSSSPECPPVTSATAPSSAAAPAAPAPRWPDLPRGLPATERLVASQVLRPEPTSSVARTPEAISAAAQDTAHVVTGYDAMAAVLDQWLEADHHPAYLLFGTMHDAPSHLTAFRRVTSRMKNLWAVGLEQLRAAGEWRAAPASVTADDADLDAFFAGDRGALERLGGRQRMLDYAAWKFGYVAEVEDEIIAARGAGTPALGCDMPPELRKAVLAGAADGGDTLSHARELHCALAVRTRLAALAARHPEGAEDDDPAPARVAMLVGALHAEPSGLPRFLPPDARVRSIYVYGGRPSDDDPARDELAAGGLLVTAPLLLPLSRDKAQREWALLLPTAAAAARVDRVHDADAKEGARRRAAVHRDPALPPVTLFVTVAEPATVSIANARVEVGPQGEWLSLRGGLHAFDIRGAAGHVLGAVRVPFTGHVELRVSLATPSIAVTDYE